MAADANLKDYLQELAKDVLSDISGQYPERCGEAVGMFVTSLYARLAEQERRANWKKKQAEGIQAARKRGTQFGRPPRPLPDNFHGICQRWRNGEISSSKAAAACGMPESTFRYQAERCRDAAL